MRKRLESVQPNSRKKQHYSKANFADVVAVAVPQAGDGLSAGELQALATEGLPIEGKTTMDEKWMGFWRHAMNTVGALVMGYGLMDEATWITVSGAILTLIPYVWSWAAKSKALPKTVKT